MTTDKVFLSSKGTGIDQVLKEAETFASVKGLKRKDSMHLRLLVEETMGMIKSIAKDFNAMFYLEGEGQECSLHLEIKTGMDAAKRRGLMAVSTSGKNTAAKGIMGKIREILETGMEYRAEADEVNLLNGSELYSYGAMSGAADAVPQAVFAWSLQQYRQSVLEQKAEEEVAEEAWDELEKSIVANLAKDVRIGIMKDTVELEIIFTYSGK